MTTDLFNYNVDVFLDTEACFGPVVFVLNLNHGIVMNLTKK